MSAQRYDSMLSQGKPIDASAMVDAEMLRLATAMSRELPVVLDQIDPDELVSYPNAVGNSPKSSLHGIDPHQSTAHGWDPGTNTGLRFPNPKYPKRLSPVIAFQVAGVHKDTSSVSDSRLERITEIGHELGERVLAAAHDFAPFAPYAHNFTTYETRSNANLAGESSILWPSVVPRGFLHAPHEDGSAATVGLNATAEGFAYYDFEQGRFVHELPEQYAFLSKANQVGHKACLHAVERLDTPVVPSTPFDIARTSVVVFLQGDDFIQRTTIAPEK